MKAAFWDAMDESFEQDVFDPVGSDVRGVFPRALARFGRGARVVADYGCGTGRQLPRLARRFDTVHGLDFAPRLLAVARERVRDLENVRLARVDLRRSDGGARRIDLGVCVNTLILPRFADREAMLRVIRNSLRSRGHLLLIVPSLESVLYANERLVEWNRRSGLRGAALLREGIPATAAAASDLLGGVVDLAGSRTKHYLREEAIQVLRDAAFDVVHEARVEYPWRAYFDAPPRWLRAPLPWDWLFVATRRD